MKILLPLATLFAGCAPLLHEGIGDRCDGRRGEIWFEADSGNVREFTNPQFRRTIDEAGTLYVCPGTYDMHFELTADGVHVQGAGPEHTVVGCNFIEATERSFDMVGFKVQGECPIGMLLHSGGQPVYLQDMQFQVSDGFGLYNNTELHGVRLGFTGHSEHAFMSWGGSAVLEQAEFVQNPGGAMYIGSGDVTLVGGSVIDNGRARAEGAVVLNAQQTPTRLVVEDTPFEGNRPADVFHQASGTTYDAGPSGTFTCDGDGCG